MTIPKGNYPEAFYRVSIKAIIRNKKGEVLLVKEDGGSWSLPGGGMDHGETAEEALAREMYEEVLIIEKFQARIIGTNPRFVKAKQAWILWVVFELGMPEQFEYGKGADADEVAFIDPVIFKDSTIVSERLVYKWCVDQKVVII
ncbi:MAG TPA: NUDIX hydrolase [Candidatus Saccharimonadales bacterium]|nr:NUDIX hydrolase [Candidatus Saccharimonadales bacterium]